MPSAHVARKSFSLDEAGPVDGVGPSFQIAPNYKVSYSYTLAKPAESESSPEAISSMAPPSVSVAVEPLAIEPYPGPSLLEQLTAQVSLDPLSKARLELKEVEFYQSQYSKLDTKEQFQAETQVLRRMVGDGASLDQLRCRAYALARCAAKVALGGKTPYDSQTLGALTMKGGTVAEMKTGEGKTLAALMPLYLNALTGQGSALITVNDYLAQSGYDELKPALETLGVTVGLVTSKQKPEEKRKAYQSDVTYVSNDTFGFDYLNDRTCTRSDQRVHRMPHFALVDEVDQILLDEARVPLIISGGAMSALDYQQLLVEGQRFKEIAAQLEPNKDIELDARQKVVTLTERGHEAVANELALSLAAQEPPSPEKDSRLQAGRTLRQLIQDFWSAKESGDTARQAEISASMKEARQSLTPVDPYQEGQEFRVPFLQTAIEATSLFQRGHDYIVQDGKVQLVDEFKGRVSDGRRLSQGLHQAIELKEGLRPDPKSGGNTVASITYPNLLRQIPMLAGMTGTAQEAKQEFEEVLGLKVAVIPPRLPSQREDLPDKVFASKREKLDYIASKTQELMELGIPVLAVSQKVESNKQLAAVLSQRDIGLQVLDTEDVKTNTPEENLAIAQAGRSGAVTAATNMAGRGVDVKPDAVNFKSLAIACDEARLRGETVVAVLDKKDQVERLGEWFAPSASGAYSDQQANLLPWKDGQETRAGAIYYVVGDPPASSEVTVFQAKDYEGKVLYVIGNERSVDPRIDEQLKGRAGRQGAPGSTEFVLSLEDDLLKLYSNLSPQQLRREFETGGSERIAEIAKEAQQRASETQSGIRLMNHRYDRVANMQRQAVWQFRDQWVDNAPTPVNPFGKDGKISQTTADFATHAYQEFMHQGLQGRRPNIETLRQLAHEAEVQFGLPIELSSPKNWQVEVETQVRQQLRDIESHLESHRGQVAPEAVATAQWRHILASVDQGWTEQLRLLEDAKQDCQLQAFIGKEPEQAYLEQCNQSLVAMWSWVKSNSTKAIVKELLGAFRATGGRL